MRISFLAALLILFTAPIPAQIEVSTFADLDSIRNDLAADYVLMNDIDASSTSDPGYNGGEGWLPIGRVGANVAPFTGTFDGLGHKITGLTINRPQESGSGLQVGLFCSVRSGGLIANLRLEEVDITGAQLVGGIAGGLYDSAMMVNCSVSGIVRGEFDVGGLVGSQPGGTVEDCWSEGSVELSGENERVGGLIGQTTSTVRRSYSTSNVSGGDWVGGLVGRVAFGSTIEECFATGTVIGTAGLVGGLAGANGGLIVRSYATGDAVADDGNGSFGGLVGRQDNASVLTDSFARGNVTGPSRIGGAVGGQSSGATMTRCFSTGMVSGNFDVGGLIGRHFDATVTASYWDTNTSGRATSDGGAGAIGLPTAEMTTPFSGGAYTGWDFVDVWLEEDEANDGYPIHQWQTVRYTLTYGAGPGGSIEGDTGQTRIPGLNGKPVTAVPDNIGYAFVQWSDGSTDNPRTDLKVMNDITVTAEFVETGIIPISTLADLDNIRNGMSGNYALVNDIDASETGDPGYNGGEGWLPLGRVGSNALPFTGTFDGQGYTITGLTFDRPEANGSGFVAGLFSGLRVNGSVTNLHLREVDFRGWGLVGGIAGAQYDSTSITNCSVSGKVSGEYNVGNLIGQQFEGLIENCWTEGEVESFGLNTRTGGLVGFASAMIRRSYSTCDVSGGDWVGGLVGRADSGSSVVECFATGEVTGTSSIVGGLAGAQEGIISRCYATGNATGLEGSFGSVAGLVGRQGGDADLHDSFARGNATGPSAIGGLVGLQRGAATINRCFSTGIPTANTTVVGGLLGSQQQDGAVTVSYWDTDSSGIATSAGGAEAFGRTTPEMTTPFGVGTYTGWDFVDVWIEEDEANDGYPFHRWVVPHTLNYAAGSGGSVVGDLEQVRIPGLSGTSVTALPNEGFEFVKWSDESTENPRQDLKVTSDVDVTAIFIDPNAVPSVLMIY